MRIQHNIMAMNAYRNYTSNVSAMKANLEKLSSGYKINRAGDDAAGLAISEKMRAQITGLNAAQKNAKDGISLVQTAEGALTEVHDMLNRMVQLATQSANGTYDNETDRAQMQKEIEQLKEEIDRIADSSNFNGIKLLNGDLDGGGADVAVKGLERMLKPYDGTSVTDVNKSTILDGGIVRDETKTKFEMNFTGVSTPKNAGSAETPEGGTAKVDIEGADPGTATTNAKFSANVAYDATQVQTLNIGGQHFQINPAAGTANAAAGDASKVTFTGDGSEGNPYTVTRSSGWNDDDLTAAIAKTLTDAGGVTIGDKTFNVTSDGTTLKFEATTPGPVKIDNADATAETFKTAIEAAVKTETGAGAGTTPTPAGPLGEVTATAGHAATTDVTAKLEVATEFTKNSTAVSSPSWAANDTVKFEAAGKDGANGFTLTFKYDGSSNWTVDTGAGGHSPLSGYTASFDGSTLTVTSDTANTATGLTTADFGSVTVTPTITSGDVDAATGTPDFTDGSAQAAAEAGIATATLTTNGLAAGDKLTIAGEVITLADEDLTDAATLATKITTATGSASGFSVTATANSTDGTVAITVTEASGSEGTNSADQLKETIKYEAAPATASAANMNVPAVMPAAAGDTPATSAKGEVTIAYQGGTTPTWANGATVTIAAAGDGTNNAFNLTFNYNGTDQTWALDESDSNHAALTGYTASFDGEKLTLTADTAGKTELEDTDFGAITVSGTTDGSTAVSGATGSMAFTNGTDAVTGTPDTPDTPDNPGGDTTTKAAEAKVAITWDSTPTWATGDTVKISAAGKDGKNAFTYTFKYTGTATTAAGDNTGWVLDDTAADNSPLNGYTPSFDGTNLTLTSNDGSKKNLTAADFGAVTVAAAKADGSTAPTGTGALTFTDAADDANGEGTVKFKAEIGDLVLGEDIEVKADAKATDIAQAVFEAIESDDTITAEVADGAKKVTINGAHYSVSYKEGAEKLEFELLDTPSKDNIAGNFNWSLTPTEGKINGSHTGGTTVTVAGSEGTASQTANTVFKIEASDIQDGAKITLKANDGSSKTVTLAIGPKSKYSKIDGAVVLTEEEAKDLDVALSRISEKFGTVGNLVVGMNRDGEHKGLTVQRDANATGDGYTTEQELAAVFSMTTKTEVNDNKGLKLQIGDTADEYNRLKVSIRDMHAEKLGIGNIDISNQEGAADAVEKIKAAINMVSDVRGTLGATQNRLDHTINNLSVMTENIQDAESTIRDTDVAEEMMAYTKNNILIQSAQAMLAQANQVPQGVLQLLQ